MSSPAAIYSDRVASYDLGRPDYPRAPLDRLRDLGGVPDAATIADVGAGTGILTAMLIAGGYRVVAVEPNAAMRGRCDRRLGHHLSYRSAAATAEDTGLPDSSVDAITVGQALHWFDLDRARREFKRILRPGGALLFLWNALDFADDEVARAVDLVLSALLPAYLATKAAEPDPAELARAAVPPGTTLHIAQIAHQQLLGADAFRSRFLSTSYAPSCDDPLVDVLAKELAAIFHTHQQDGAVTLRYWTTAITGVCAGGTPEGDHG